jgi:hypothetical protein
MNLPTLRLEAITQFGWQMVQPVKAWQVMHALGKTAPSSCSVKPCHPAASIFATLAL